MGFPGQMLHHSDDIKKASALLHFPYTFFDPIINCPSQILGIISSINFLFCEKAPFGDLNFHPEHFFGCSSERKWLFIPIGTLCTIYWLLPHALKCQVKEIQSSYWRPVYPINDQSTATISFLRLVIRTLCILKFWSIIIIHFFYYF